MELLPEVEVWWGLPALRKHLTEALKEQGLSQRTIAEKLGIAESAVSQYLSGKRGASNIPKEFHKQILLSAKEIASGDNDTTNKELIRLLDLLRTTRTICDIHKQHGNVPHNCDHCFH